MLPDGESLHDHVKKTQKLFEEDSAAFDTWEMVLYSTGYDPENSYDNRRWVLGANHDYEVVDGFRGSQALSFKEWLMFVIRLI